MRGTSFLSGSSRQESVSLSSPVSEVGPYSWAPGSIFKARNVALTIFFLFGGDRGDDDISLSDSFFCLLSTSKDP